MEQFLKYVGVLAGIYVAQTVFKISSTRKNNTFDFKELIDGILDHILRFIGIIIFFYAGTFVSEMQIIPIGDKVLTIDDALIAFAYGLIAYQSVQFFGNIKEAYSMKDDDIVKTLNEAVRELG